MLHRKRLMLPMDDPDFWKMYRESVNSSERSGWFFSEERTRPYNGHLVLYFWREAE